MRHLVAHTLNERQLHVPFARPVFPDSADAAHKKFQISDFRLTSLSVAVTQFAISDCDYKLNTMPDNALQRFVAFISAQRHNGPSR
jgi:hypothetical protein